MSIKEICLGGGGLVLLLMTLIQIAPIKLDPWSAVAKAIGRALNSEVLIQLSVLRENLDTHIRVDDERKRRLIPNKGSCNSTMSCYGIFFIRVKTSLRFWR